MRGRFVCVLMSLLGAGCTESGKPEHSSPNVKTRPEPSTSPITEEEIRKFGLDLEKAVATKNAVMANSAIPLAHLSKRCLEGLALNEVNARAASTKAGEGIVARWVNAVAQGGEFALAGVRTTPEGPRLLMRMVIEPRGANYFDFSFTRDRNGEIVVDEVFIVNSGETFSELIRRYVVVHFRKDPAVQNHVDAKYADAAAALIKAVQANHDPRVPFQKLPEELRERMANRVVLVTGLQKIDHNAYLAEAERFVEKFQGTLTADFHAIDLYLHKKDRKRFDAAFDRLEQTLQDPWLVTMRAASLAKFRDLDGADAVIMRAIAAKPERTSLFFEGINIANEAKDYERMRDWFKRQIVATKTDYDFVKLGEIVPFREFAKTTEYAELVEWANQGEPVSDEQAEDFGRELERLVRDGKLEPLRQKLDIRAVVSCTVLSMRGLPGTVEVDARLREPNFCSTLQRQVGLGGSFQFVRVLQEEGQTRVLMRAVTLSRIVKYHLFTLAQTRSSKFRLVEYEDVFDGMTLTAAIRNLHCRRVPAGQTNRLSQVERIRASETKAIDLFEAQPSLILYDKLPKILKEERSVLLKAMTRVGIEKAQFQELKQQYAKLHGEDHSYDLVAVQTFHPRLTPDEKEAAVDRLLEWTKDPYLEIIRARTRRTLLDESSVVITLNAAIEKYPDFTELYWAKITHLVERKEMEQAFEVLKTLRARPGHNLGSDVVRETAGFADRLRLELNPFIEWCKNQAG